jgi:hypothetical protein
VLSLAIVIIGVGASFAVYRHVSSSSTAPDPLAGRLGGLWGFLEQAMGFDAFYQKAIIAPLAFFAGGIDMLERMVFVPLMGLAEAIIKGKGEYKAVPDAKEEDIVKAIRAHVEKDGRKVAAIEKEVLENGNAIYVIALDPRRDGVFLFTRLESRASLCDICHDSHFFYILDQDGIIQDFFPLQLTKLGNVPWTDEDTAKIKKQISGRNIFDAFPFNPKADAVSTATMSSSLVYESLNSGKKVFADLKTYKFRYEHWKQLCLKNMCAVAAKIAELKKREPGLAADDALLQKTAKDLGGGCPQDGTYIYLDGSILCSNHGMLPPDCKK